MCRERGGAGCGHERDKQQPHRLPDQEVQRQEHRRRADLQRRPRVHAGGTRSRRRRLRRILRVLPRRRRRRRHLSPRKSRE